MVIFAIELTKNKLLVIFFTINGYSIIYNQLKRIVQDYILEDT